MEHAAGFFFRLICSAAAFFLFVLVLLLLQNPSWASLFSWPFLAGFGLMGYGWYGVLFLAAGSQAADWELVKLLDRTRTTPRLRSAALAMGDLTAGACASYICYADNEVFLYSGFAITVLYTAMYRGIERLHHAKRDTPTAD
ncbi:hypothetical protein GE107_13280 [Cohnella sp. CFH 77786]|uniref:hypothetical protein n=1 Tax=Cohnella sp. CFH 77786 TaxID=2662265 RepID=UPI001C60DEFC|nr:hypothetical protein [Cohnella sp. CFH 77786]MBW5447035.1 hypothetical protein [Cohnella sp. CFH 77786]